MHCELAYEIRRLRKQSQDSVENTDSFGEYNRYMHVERQIEIELREILRKVNSNSEKNLFLLCGSAGDGKSHLMSYLKHNDDEHLLDTFELYNDATESSEPRLTSIDTLAEKLSRFSDEHIDENDNTKVIIAINLGTLSNFIESDKGKQYTRLKKYVVQNGILSGYSKKSSFIEGSIFQHVNFSDYQVFALDGSGYKTTFLEDLMKKVFDDSLDNPFYIGYTKCENCTYKSRCPVKHNFEYLSDEIRQKAIIKRIVQAVIMDKAIVSTREVLNLLHDLIIHPEFDPEKIKIGVTDVQYLTDYIRWTTPMLLNEYNDISPLLNMLKRHDVLKERTVSSDEDALKFHSMTNIRKVFIESTQNTPYQVISDLTQVDDLGGIKPELKKIVYRFIARINGLDAENSEESKSEKRLAEFISYLYYQNTHNERQLRQLYEIAKKAIMAWNGQFGDDYICIDDTNERYWILEYLNIVPAPDIVASVSNESIQRFAPTVKLKFKQDGMNEEVEELSVDFALFELISDMNEGYRPTVKDKNLHTDFASYVNRVIEFGNKSKRITIIPKGADKNEKYIFSRNSFSYDFKVES